jgi:hypothetical protein
MSEAYYDFAARTMKGIKSEEKTKVQPFSKDEKPNTDPIIAQISAVARPVHLQHEEEEVEHAPFRLVNKKRTTVFSLEASESDVSNLVFALEYLLSSIDNNEELFLSKERIAQLKAMKAFLMSL